MVDIKKNNLPTTRINQRTSFSKRTLVTAIFSIVGILLIHSHNAAHRHHEQKKSSSLRTATHLSSKPNVVVTDDKNKANEKVLTQLESKPVVDENAVEHSVTKAMSDMSDSVKDEFLITMDWMHDAVVGTKTSIHRSMDYFLNQYGNYTADEVEEIDNEVADQVEEKLEADLMELVNKAVLDANKDLQSLVKSEVDEKYETKEIEKDVDTIRSYYVERLKAEVDSLEGEMENKIHSISQEVEKKILKEKVGIDESNKDLDDREVKSIVTEKEDEVFQSANDKAIILTEDIGEAEKSLQENIREALTKFLVEKKNLSISKAKEIEQSVEEDLDNTVKTILQQEIETLEESANTEADEVRDIADEDITVIESAKELGMTADENSNKAAMVETSLKALKTELESSFKELVENSRSRVINRMKDSTKDIENNILKENGINISDEELDELVEKEMKSLTSAK